MSEYDTPIASWVNGHYRHPSMKTLKNRLESWKDELKTNRYGMKGNAPRAIEAISKEIERRGGRT